MVANTGAASRTGGIRPLDEPLPVQVGVGDNDMPAAIGALRNRNAGRQTFSHEWRQVLEVLDSWRIDDEWWRKQPVSRLYYRVLLEDGTVVGLFKDLVSGEWYRQRV